MEFSGSSMSYSQNDKIEPAFPLVIGEKENICELVLSVGIKARIVKQRISV